MITKKKKIKKENISQNKKTLKKEKKLSKKSIPNNIAKVKSVNFAKRKKEEKKQDDDNEISTKKVRIKVIGIGGGGGNIVFELSKRLKDFSSQKIEFVVANTDTQALRSISKNLKIFSFGSKITNGLGCGSDVSVGEKAAREDIEKIKNLFTDKKDLYIIVSSFGGGTGTGAAPVFAKIANDLKLSTLSIFTLPFAFEGKKKMDYSNSALEKLKENVNAYMVLPNEKIFSFSREELSFSEALGLLNNHLANCLEGLFRTIYNPGLINIDWADIRTVLEGTKKLAYIDMIKIKNVQNLEEFTKNILKNPILDYNFEDADNIIFNIESSKELSLQSLFQVSEKISVHVPNARIIFGLSQNQKLKNEIRVAIFSTTSDGKNIAKNDWKNKNSKLKPVVKDGTLNLELESKKEKVKENEPVSKETKQGEKKQKKISSKKKGEDLKNEKIKKETATTIINEKDDLIETDNDSGTKEIRRNALQVKEIERLEREEEDSKEKIFDIPAFLRKEKKS
ncbi:MAG: cell division protein FtsZ [Candidatus Pacebacteria bacterium]|nr:cell division protein FtsZ [Candidatus Paceibacterota bacterium]